MDNIIEFPKVVKEEELVLTDELVLNFLRAIYEEEEEAKGQVISFPNAYSPNKYEEYCSKLKKLNVYNYIQELDYYIKEIDYYIDTFKKDALNKSDAAINELYLICRDIIIYHIAEYAYSLCSSYDLSFKCNEDSIEVEGIKIKFDNDEFSLEYVYNSIINIALFMDKGRSY